MYVMKRIIYTCLLLVGVLFRIEARTPMRDWLISMPDSVLPLLTKNNRLDFIDFYDAKMEAVVTNRMDGKSRLDTLTDDFARINYTRTTDVAMKLLVLNDTADVLCIVTTVKASADDSRIAFFDAQWSPLELSAFLTEPRIEDFRVGVSDDSAAWAWSKMDVFFRTYRLCAEDTELRCVLTTTDFLSADDKETVIPYVNKQPLIYRWESGKYKRHE